MKTIIRAPRGTARQEVPIDEVRVPDLWHIAMWLKDNEGDISIHNHLSGQSYSDAVLECWHLCNDLLLNLRGDTAPR